MIEVDGRKAKDLRARLLRWYDASARDLPWRRTRDPYAIWLSETMLQQTRVETVLRHYDAFLRRFPAADQLARADAGEVLEAWAGLGYYRRARALHAAAKEVVERYGGALPSDPSELRTLPGVGPYTAGAIASIAFGVKAPLVDGNVARVLSRIFDIREAVGTAGATRAFEGVARRLVPERRPGDFNQALMELGATVCTPRSPRCPACPIAGVCAAFERGTQGELPIIGAQRAPKTLRMTAAVAVRAGRILLAKRPNDGLYGGLWEPPMLLVGPRRARAAFAAAGLETARSLGRVRHVLTHRVLDVTVVAAEAREPVTVAPYEAVAWKPVAAPGLSTLARKVIAAAGALALLVLVGLGTGEARAEDAPPAEVPEPRPAVVRRLEAEPGFYARIFGTLSAGKGLRFNNPYRLETVLGDDAAGPSLTAAYVDVAATLLFGAPDGLQHGASVHVGSSVEGLTQPFVTPSYALAYRADLPIMVYGRAGPVIVLAPDANVGGELAASFSYFFLAGLGVTSELAFDLFYGAATLTEQYSVVPVLNLQMGVIADYEFLP